MAKLIDIANIMQLFARKNRFPDVKNTLFRHCTETKMDVFVDCLVDHNFRRLIKYGHPTESEIQRAWENLFSEYCELTSTPGYKYILQLTKDIGALNSKIMSVNLCLQVLAYRYSEPCVKTLHRFGYRAKFDFTDKHKYLDDLRSVKTKLKAAHLALDQKTKEYQNAISDTSGKTPTQDYFINTLIELSKYMGYRLKLDELSVTEYVSILKKREHEIELSNRYALKQKHGSKG